MNILIVEDNRDIADNIADYLESLGHGFDFAGDGITAIQKALSGEHDAIILDIMLPGIDGYTVCRKLRQESSKQIPILMLTARDTLPDKLEGFSSGTDDYLVKPFALEELVARLHALVNRTGQDMENTCKVGDLEINPLTREVRREGSTIALNRTCFKILHVLMLAAPNVVSRAELERRLWEDMPPGSDSLRSHIYTLRSKIDKPFSRTLLHTIHGIGYRIYDERSSS